jgi:hypothetical protein
MKDYKMIVNKQDVKSGIVSSGTVCLRQEQTKVSVA